MSPHKRQALRRLDAAGRPVQDDAHGARPQHQAASDPALEVFAEESDPLHAIDQATEDRHGALDLFPSEIAADKGPASDKGSAADLGDGDRFLRVQFYELPLDADRFDLNAPDTASQVAYEPDTRPLVAPSKPRHLGLYFAAAAAIVLIPLLMGVPWMTSGGSDPAVSRGPQRTEAVPRAKDDAPARPSGPSRPSRESTSSAAVSPPTAGAEIPAAAIAPLAPPAPPPERPASMAVAKRVERPPAPVAAPARGTTARVPPAPAQSTAAAVDSRARTAELQTPDEPTPVTPDPVARPESPPPIVPAPQAAATPAAAPPSPGQPNAAPPAALPASSTTVSSRAPEPPAAPPPPRPADETAAAAARDTAAVRSVLTRYGNAFSGLNAAAVGEVWPSVDERALERAFRGLAEQDVAFDNCQIGVNGAEAVATCSGTVRYVTRIGSRTPRMEHRVWQFSLRRAGAGWLIDRVNSR